jgi:hypothetical protein
LIQSRRRKGELLFEGLFSPRGLFARKGLTQDKISELKRVIFFEGSSMFAGKKLPFLESFPVNIVGAKEGTQPEADAPEMDNGDYMIVTNCVAYCEPELLTDPGINPGGEETIANDNDQSNGENGGVPGVSTDLRCSDCTMAFVDLQACMNHSRDTGHMPYYETSFEKKPANPTVFTTYCNIALQRAMGEKLARWGREYIDPEDSHEPKDKQGRPLGVRVFRAYVSLWKRGMFIC